MQQSYVYPEILKLLLWNANSDSFSTHGCTRLTAVNPRHLRGQRVDMLRYTLYIIKNSQNSLLKTIHH